MAWLSEADEFLPSRRRARGRQVLRRSGRASESCQVGGGEMMDAQDRERESSSSSWTEER